MRKIGDFHDAADARALGEYLLAHQISNQVDPEQDGRSWSVWVHDDDQLDVARERMQFFREHPAHPSIRDSQDKAKAIREEKEREAKQFRGKPVDVRTQWHRESMRPMWMTQTLVGICIVVWVIDNFVPHGREFTRYLYFSDPEYFGYPSLWHMLVEVLRGRIGLAEAFGGNYWFVDILHGQIWRLLTPVFMHSPLRGSFSILHILFNMMWLRMLGPIFERQQGPWQLLLKVVVIGILSNIAQYAMSGPAFLGFSGVVYGLFGYIWIRGRYDPDPEYYIDRNTVSLFLIWLVLGILGMIGPVGNSAHAGGLIVGMIWGYASSGRLRWKMRRLMR